jgi:hypothetical protein
MRQYRVYVVTLAALLMFDIPGQATAGDASPPPKSTQSTDKASDHMPAICIDWLKGEEAAADETSSANEVKCSIWQVVNNIRSLRDEVQGSHGRLGKLVVKSRWQTMFDSTTIALGIGSVATALYGGPASAIAGLALAGTGVDRYRSYYNPEGQGAAYVKALSATRCVSSNAEIYLQVAPQDLWNAIASLKAAIADVDATAAAVANAPATKPSGQDRKANVGAVAAATVNDAAISQTSADAANAALVAANEALSSLQAEASALIQAVSGIDKAHDAIKNYLDSALHRQTTSTSDVQLALNQGLSAAQQSAAATLTARDNLYAAIAAQAKNQVQTGKTTAGVVPQRF